MKSIKIYIFLILGVVVLIAAAAVLTNMLMTITLPEHKTAKTERKTKAGSEEVTAALETTIQLDGPPKPAADNEPAWKRSGNKTEEPGFRPPAPPEAPGIGSISSIRGTAQLISADNKPTSLRTEQRINISDKIITGPDSQIQITFDDGSIISQGENSSIVIDEFLYSPNEPDKNHFTMRIIKGVCRSVSGMITNLNPNRFKVKTRMATIGIRGCDLIFKSTRFKDDIYVLDLAGTKQVVIETTTNGSPVRDPAADKDLPIDSSIKKSITIEEPNQMVSLKLRTPPQQSETDKTTLRRLIDMSSIVRPAKYELIQGSDGIIIDIKTQSDDQAL